MKILFSKLPTPSAPEEQLRYVKRNLDAYYIHSLGLSEINNQSQLLEKCKILERNRLMADWSVQAASVQQNRKSVEPGLASPSTSGINVRSRSTNFAKCWICDANGHSFPECKKPRSMFCYKCGKKGVRRLNCSNCNKSGNESSRV